VNHAIPLDPHEDLAALFGMEDRFLRALREAFGVRLSARQNTLNLSGPPAALRGAEAVLDGMRKILRSEGRLSQGQVMALISRIKGGDPETRSSSRGAPAPVAPKSAGQQRYLEAIRQHDITFCTGPAGTGKTFLAVAAAVEALRAGGCKRIVLARPAVEAGEHLGFLPGDLQEKVNPYLRPLFDSLDNLLEPEEARRLIQSGVVEVVPLAFMRGRTLDRSFVILDEGQNCTVKQMLMFLTRLGAASKAVVAGDTTQTDLPADELSGLTHAWEILQQIQGLSFVALEQGDIVRHPLVRKIIQAYEDHPPKA
jgi:phosphate starvation-inducible PhoH-like protein